MKEKIGVIARYTGLAAHTIKYYENMGLIDNVRDEQSNYRYYDCLLYTSPSPRD